MAHQIISLKCANCGDTVDTSQKVCKYCKQPVIISTFNSVYEMPMPLVYKYTGTYKEALSNDPNNVELNNSIAMCYFKLKIYDMALLSFEKAMESNFDNSETYFYAAISLLEGKKAFVADRPKIDRIERYINAAIAIEPKGIYYYLLAYIKYDYFSRKYFKTSPTYQEALAEAHRTGLSSYDVDKLYEILEVEHPSCI